MKLPNPNYRRENIAHLFTCVIYSMEIVTKEYDCTYERLKKASKGKHDEFTLHQRALLTCKRLLNIKTIELDKKAETKKKQAILIANKIIEEGCKCVGNPGVNGWSGMCNCCGLPRLPFFK